MVKQRLKSLGLEYDARIDYDRFERFFSLRADGLKFVASKTLEGNFVEPETPQEVRIADSIENHRLDSIQKLEVEWGEAYERLGRANQKRELKVTKAIEKEKGIAERKIKKITEKLALLKSPASLESEARLFAFNWAPVIVCENGKRLIVPMRYHLRPKGADEDFDRKFPGCYNARLDNLQGFWKKQFGSKHALLVVTSFFENVKKHDYERRPLAPGEAEENMVLQFRPEGFDEMLVPCLWEEWQFPKGCGLGSFALITDDPPPEIAETGHNRCPIFLKREHVQMWLNPDRANVDELLKILKDCHRPFYRHLIAA